MGPTEKEIQMLPRLVVRASKRGIKGGSSVTGSTGKGSEHAACGKNMWTEAIWSLRVSTPGWRTSTST